MLRGDRSATACGRLLGAQVTEAEIQAFVNRNNNIPFFATSSRDGQGVDVAFSSMVRELGCLPSLFGFLRDCEVAAAQGHTHPTRAADPVFVVFTACRLLDAKEMLKLFRSGPPYQASVR